MKMDFTIHKELVMDGLPTAFCHASTIIKLRSGGLLCCWFGGSHEGEADVAIYAARRDGAGWSAPVKMAEVRKPTRILCSFIARTAPCCCFTRKASRLPKATRYILAIPLIAKTLLQSPWRRESCEHDQRMTQAWATSYCFY